MNRYNIRTGKNTVLRGLIAEEFARYILLQKYPLLIIKPFIALQYLEKAGIKGQSVQFLQKYQHTMDYLGIGPIEKKKELKLQNEEIVIRFFLLKEGLTRFLELYSWEHKLKGYIIEVKSRTSITSWAPFRYTISQNQELMFNEIKKFGFELILCGVTFEPKWNLSITLYNHKGKIFQDNFLSSDK